jgi:hypothetical protein
MAGSLSTANGQASDATQRFFREHHLAAERRNKPLSPTNIFAPVSTPAHAIHELFLFVLGVTAVRFFVNVSGTWGSTPLEL